MTIRVMVPDRHDDPRGTASAAARRVLADAFGLDVFDVISVHSATPRFRGGQVAWNVVARVRGAEPAIAAAVRSAERGATWAVDGSGPRP